MVVLTVNKFAVKVYKPLKPAYSELVLKPGNRESCGRKCVLRKNTLSCMAGFTLALVCVTAAGQLVVVL